jgi:hypothetical protein
MIDTSTTTDFKINGATFEDNEADSNTVMLIMAYGAFEYCKFTDNKAESFT